MTRVNLPEMKLWISLSDSLRSVQNQNEQNQNKNARKLNVEVVLNKANSAA